MTTQSPTSSPLGYGLSCTYCSCILPYPTASLTPVYVTVNTIQPPFGLGTRNGALLPSVVAGRQLLSEAIERRLATPRGTLPDTKAPTTVGNYGIAIEDDVDADMTASDAGKLAASIDAQCRQDERVFYSHTTVTLAGSTLTIVVQLVDGTGPFKLTLSVNMLTGNTQLLGGS